jgi:hypothetical protein
MDGEDILMDEILKRFSEAAPVAVMVQATLRRVFANSALDALFERHAQGQYTRELAFSTVTRLMVEVVTQKHPSLHAAYRHAQQPIPVAMASVYNKVNGLEPGISHGLVHDTATAMQAIIEALPGGSEPKLAGLRLRTLDGNFLAGTDHRLDCLRGSGAAALPGMSLVVRDGRTGLLTDLIPREDAYTNERSLFSDVLALVQADDLWLADRNFCTLDYLGGIAEKEAFFLIRHHAGTKLQTVGKLTRCGSNASGKIYEQKVRIGWLECRCIVVRLYEPLRDGSTELRILTNVPAQRLRARRALTLYHTRWRNEVAVATEGMLIAMPEKTWQRFVKMPVKQLARWLGTVAQRAQLWRYRKSPRGPKKPTTVQRTSRGAHRSTARQLATARHTLSP